MIFSLSFYAAYISLMLTVVSYSGFNNTMYKKLSCFKNINTPRRVMENITSLKFFFDTLIWLYVLLFVISLTYLHFFVDCRGNSGETMTGFKIR